MTGLEQGAPRTAVCCRRPMTTIEVTHPLGDACTLALHTCSACGRHVWERDGVALDRSEVLEVVQNRIAEGPSARVPGPRAPRPSRAQVTRSAPPPAPAVPPARLAEFIVHGTPRP